MVRMNILAMETSAKACSVALCQGEQLIAQNFIHSQLTHSKRLLLLLSNLLDHCELSMKDIDLLAIAVGPGSFTGLRIGIATLKGLAFGSNIPCVPCSTLGSMAWQLSQLEGYTVVPVMDARRNQVYSSHFLIEQGIPKRLCPDRAIAIEDLGKELEQISSPKILIGDGAELCLSQLTDISIAPSHLRQQQASGVAREAWELRDTAFSAQDLLPEYHRLSQAERERLEKQNKT